LRKSATLEEALEHVETQDVFFKAEATEEEAQEENSPPMMSYRIGQVAAHLDISPFKLRQLSQRFADWLSDEATTDKVLEHDRPASHLYDDEDVEVLQTILELEQEGLSDDEIDEQLDDIYADMASLAVIDPQGNQALMTPAAMAVLGQGLHQLSETQQALLNTQQSHRDLLSVVVKDAMSVKEENERLRKRLRMIEEEMARLKESDWNHRLALEERINELAHEKEQKRSWWGRLRGE
jgi:DNA-binding transcriptional MerR regulator